MKLTRRTMIITLVVVCTGLFGAGSYVWRRNYSDFYWILALSEDGRTLAATRVIPPTGGLWVWQYDQSKLREVTTAYPLRCGTVPGAGKIWFCLTPESASEHQDYFRVYMFDPHSGATTLSGELPIGTISYVSERTAIVDKWLDARCRDPEDPQSLLSQVWRWNAEGYVRDIETFRGLPRPCLARVIGLIDDNKWVLVWAPGDPYEDPIDHYDRVSELRRQQQLIVFDSRDQKVVSSAADYEWANDEQWTVGARGTRLLRCTRNCVQVWSLPKLESVASFRQPGAFETDRWWRCAISPNGRFIVTGGDALWLLDLENGSVVMLDEGILPYLRRRRNFPEWANRFFYWWYIDRRCEVFRADTEQPLWWVYKPFVLPPPLPWEAPVGPYDQLGWLDDGTECVAVTTAGLVQTFDVQKRQRTGQLHLWYHGAHTFGQGN